MDKKDITSFTSGEKAGRYMNPLTDFGFKKIFGEKDIMIAFLTDLLNPKVPIEDVIFIDKELAEDEEEQRGVIYDLRCKAADGSEFIVEMQNKKQTNFSDRIIFYLSRAFSTQGKRKTEWDYKLSPVYGVFFLNFHLKGMKSQSVRTVQLRVDETGEVFSEKLKVFTLELPDYRDKPMEYPKTRLEYWLYNLANMETMETQLPFQSQQPIFSKIGGLSELLNMSEEDRKKYYRSLDDYWTDICVMESAVEEGFEKGMEKGIEKGMAMGIEKGKAEGMETTKIETALKMKRCGFPIEQIVLISGLSEEEIEKLE